LLDRIEGPSGFEPAYDSGSCANVTRLGVDLPDPIGGLPLPKKPPTLSIEGVREGTGEAGADGTLSEEWGGGELGLVEEEWVPFVSNRDIEAVACDVLAIGSVDVLIIKAGGRGTPEVVDLRDVLDADRDNLACSASV